MTALAQRAAVMAVLEAGGARPMTSSDLAAYKSTNGRLPAWYTEVWLSEKPGEVDRVGGSPGSRAWRLQTRAVAQDEDNALVVREKARAALHERVLTVAGVESTAIRGPVTDDPIGPDDGWFSGLSEWSYVC